MQLYLLALNLFSLTALLLGLEGFSSRSRWHRLLPLVLLAISRSLILIIYLSRPTPLVIGSLEIFSTFCFTWAIIGPRMPSQSAAGAALLLALLPLLPVYPLAPQLHSFIIAASGLAFLFAQAGPVRRPHLAALLLLALAPLLTLGRLSTLAQLVGLLAYALFIQAIHRYSLQTRHKIYQTQHQATETLVQQALDLNREQRRWLKANQDLHKESNPAHIMNHIAHSLTDLLQVDQVAIFTLDGQIHLAAVHSVTQLNPPAQEITAPLDEYPPLQQALETRQSLLYPDQLINGLSRLYTLWDQAHIGPTLIQPLILPDQPVGVLLLGNPITQRLIPEADVHLCRQLAPQIAALVEHARRFLTLENQLKKQPRPTPPLPVEPPATGLAARLRKPLPASQIHVAISQAISDGIVVSDSRGRVRWANQAAEHILGQSHHQILNQPIGKIYGKIASEEPIEDLLVSFSRRNLPLPTFAENKDRTIQGQLIPWRSPQNEWLGIITVFRDITPEIKANQARNDFILSLTRELRGPLAVLRGYSELIVNSATEDYTPDQARVQRIIHSQAERMAQVLNNAAQIGIQHRHEILPQLEEIDPTRLITQALKKITPLAQLHELALSQEIKTDLPPLITDPEHLQTILNNLLSNACHFTPPGGQVTLRAWVQTEKAAANDRPHLVISVADNGVGIAPAETRRVFDLFYQADNQRPDVDRGMGVGLTVVKELVELHQGRAWVESTPGQGSIFQVALPLNRKY